MQNLRSFRAAQASHKKYVFSFLCKNSHHSQTSQMMLQCHVHMNPENFAEIKIFEN